MSKENTRVTINANIKQNGNQEITGQILNSVLNTMVDDYAEQEKLTELEGEVNTNTTDIEGLKEEVALLNPIVNYGTIINAPDNEDLTSVNNVLKFRDRSSLDGMGYVILRKGDNLAIKMAKENTIYEIRYDFDLGGDSITVPNNCILFGNGGSITHFNNIIIGENVRVYRLKFDGVSSCGAVYVNNSNVEFKGCSFTNFRPSAEGASYCIRANYGVSQTSNIDNIIIESCSFDNISAYDTESTSSGDNDNTICRVIGMRGINNGVIKGCTFTNTRGFGDGDIIAIQSTSSYSDSEPPYCFSDATHIGTRLGDSNVLIEGNTFVVDHCKSAIKVQASGVIVTNNYIVMDITSDKRTFAIRFPSGYNSVVSNNYIQVKNDYANSVLVELNGASGVRFSNNSVSMQDMADTSSLRNIFHIRDSFNVSISDNDGYIKNVSSFMYVVNSALTLTDNTFAIKGDSFSINDGDITVTYNNGIDCPVVIKNNTFTAFDTIESVDFSLDNINHLEWADNNIDGCSYVVFTQGNDTAFMKNKRFIICNTEYNSVPYNIQFNTAVHYDEMRFSKASFYKTNRIASSTCVIVCEDCHFVADVGTTLDYNTDVIFYNSFNRSKFTFRNCSFVCSEVIRNLYEGGSYSDFLDCDTSECFGDRTLHFTLSGSTNDPLFDWGECSVRSGNINLKNIAIK